LDQLIGGLGQDWFITDDLADSVDQALLGLLAELRDNVLLGVIFQRNKEQNITCTDFWREA